MKLRDVLPALALTLMAGCHEQPPAGQVIATVDGQSLTQYDLAADLLARHLVVETTGDRVRSAVTMALVDRKLLADQARANALDKEPSYLAMAARAEEMALVEQLLAKWRSAIPMPPRSEAQLLIDRNPQMFAERMIYLLDEVHTDVKGLDSKALATLRSMDAVTDYLDRNDHPFRRGSATIDTLTTGALPARRLARLATGEPFVSARDATLVIRSVVRSTPAPLLGEQAFGIAELLVRRAAFQQVLQQKVAALRAAATITYSTVRAASG